MTYEFSITLSGTGKDISEAWADACMAFTLDPGVYDETLVTISEEIEQ